MPHFIQCTAVCIHRKWFKTQLNDNQNTNICCYSHSIFGQDITFWKKWYQTTCHYKTFELHHNNSKYNNNSKNFIKYEKWLSWDYRCNTKPWWHHQMKIFSTLLAIYVGNSGEFPTQRPVTRSFDVFFDLRLNKQDISWNFVQIWEWHCKTAAHWESRPDCARTRPVLIGKLIIAVRYISMECAGVNMTSRLYWEHSLRPNHNGQHYFTFYVFNLFQISLMSSPMVQLTIT